MGWTERRCDDNSVSAESLIASSWLCPKLAASWSFDNEPFESDLGRVLGFSSCSCEGGSRTGVSFLRSSPAASLPDALQPPARTTVGGSALPSAFDATATDASRWMRPGRGERNHKSHGEARGDHYKVQARTTSSRLAYANSLTVVNSGISLMILPPPHVAPWTVTHP